MLSKEACKKCWGKEWTRHDDLLWMDRKESGVDIFCKNAKAPCSISIIARTSKPPDWCQYKLEHAIAETEMNCKRLQ